MKWFLSILALVIGIAVVGASCGPQELFCPTGNPNMSDYTCHQNLDAATGGAGGSDDLCDGMAPISCNGVKMCGTACPQ